MMRSIIVVLAALLVVVAVTRALVTGEGYSALERRGVAPCEQRVGRPADAFVALSREGHQPSASAVARREGLPLVDVRDFGARGDCRATDDGAIQKAIDSVDAAYGHAGGIVHVPGVDVGRGGCYLLDRPLVLRSNVVLVGDGSSSLLRNRRAWGAEPAPIGAVLMIGNHARSDSGASREGDDFYSTYAIRPVTRGSSKIALVDSSAAVDVSPGELVVIRNEKPTAGWDVKSVANYRQFNRVVSVDRATGRLELEYPIDRTLPASAYGPRLVDVGDSGVAPNGIERFIAQRIGVHAVALEAAGNAVQRTACFECSLTSLDIRSASVLYGNGWQRTLFRDIDGTFWFRAIENSFSSMHNRYESIHMTYAPPQTTSVEARQRAHGVPLIAWNEGGGYHCVDDVRLDAGAHPFGAMLSLRAARGVVVRNSRLSAERRGGTGALIASFRGPAVGNTIADTEFEMCEPRAFVRVAQGVGRRPSPWRTTGNARFGAGSAPAILMQGGATNRIQGNRFVDHCASAPL